MRNDLTCKHVPQTLFAGVETKIVEGVHVGTKASVQVCMCAGVHHLQVCNCASVQLCMCANVHVCGRTHEEMDDVDVHQSCIHFCDEFEVRLSSIPVDPSKMCFQFAFVWGVA